ncbi:MAG: ATP-dependent DNA helicase RecG [bacterium]
MISLISPVRYIKGVGPLKAARLSRLGLHTIKDVIEYFPREWSDRTNITPIGELKQGIKSTVYGSIAWHSVKQVSAQVGVFHLYVKDHTGIVDAVWIRRLSYTYDVFASLAKKITQAESIVIYGYIDVFAGKQQLRVEDYELNPAKTDSFCKIVPIYPLTEGIDQKLFRRIVTQAFNALDAHVSDVVPIDRSHAGKLMPRSKALRLIHYPHTLDEAERARRSLAYHEFLFLAIAHEMNRLKIRSYAKEHQYVLKKNLLSLFKKNLSFEFTSAQKKVIREIFSDLQSSRLMNRLLQGDVGSGKTVVAVAAMLLAAENGYQSAFMAPTEILAEQHFYTLLNFCKNLPVTVALIKGGMKKKEKQVLLDNIRSGEISILAGTHALLERNVKFNNLKLIVIDEQHRFGVMQRSILQSHGDADTLVMTATPIPRTLALTVYGDLEVSVLDEIPPGRKPVQTAQVSDTQAYRIILQEIAQGNQAYIVYPLIQESEKIELKSVIQEWHILSQTVFSSYSVGLLHGHMPHDEKYKVMKDFSDKKIKILMSTTVIEVGIDVPDAAVMFIQHAERFGLSTLHQLRGRIGRGAPKGICLIGGKASTPQAQERFNIFQQTTDGFKIGEEDLRLRGPGEFLGTAQHGLPEFKAGNLITDIDLIQLARNDAKNLITNKPVVEAVFKKYGEKINLINVG